MNWDYEFERCRKEAATYKMLCTIKENFSIWVNEFFGWIQGFHLEWHQGKVSWFLLPFLLLPFLPSFHFMTFSIFSIFYFLNLFFFLFFLHSSFRFPLETSEDQLAHWIPIFKSYMGRRKKDVPPAFFDFVDNLLSPPEKYQETNLNVFKFKGKTSNCLVVESDVFEFPKARMMRLPYSLVVIDPSPYGLNVAPPPATGKARLQQGNNEGNPLQPPLSWVKKGKWPFILLHFCDLLLLRWTTGEFIMAAKELGYPHETMVWIKPTSSTTSLFFLLLLIPSLF